MLGTYIAEHNCAAKDVRNILILYAAYYIHVLPALTQSCYGLSELKLVQLFAINNHARYQILSSFRLAEYDNGLKRGCFDFLIWNECLLEVTS